MRWSACLLFAASVGAFGQSTKPPETEPPPTFQLFPKDGSKPLQIPLRKFNFPAFAPKVCAIPLLNFLPQHFESKMPIEKPPSRPSETAREPELKVPAPACNPKLFQNK